MRGTTGDNASLRECFEDDLPCVAVSFADDATAADIAAAIANGMDIAEIRIDHFGRFDTAHVTEQVRRFDPVPTIATIRSHAEGGEWEGADAERRDLFDAVLPWVDAVDVELSARHLAGEVIAAAHELERLAIVSFHDFSHTPTNGELSDVTARAVARGADVVKLAVMVNSPEDLRRLAAFTLANRDIGLIVIGMGPIGTPSRVLLPFLGSQLTFATDNRWSAPGQLTLEETVRTMSVLSPAFAARLSPV